MTPNAHRLDGAKHPVEHWEEEFGFKIKTATGWRKRGLEFDRPLTADAFLLLGMESVIYVESFQKMIDTGAIELPKLEEN